jgi:elongation factor Ts
MADITSAMVGKLREITGAGMMDCKKALTEVSGNMEAAMDLLRKKGQASAAKKSLKEAREGVISRYISPDSKVGVLVEVNCQTDFVARNDAFRAFCEEVGKTLSTNPNADFEARRTELVAKTGENVKVARHQRFEVAGSGLVAAYIHTGEKVGVLVEVVAGKDATVASDEFKGLVKDITLQIAAANPISVSRDQVDPKIVEKEKEIAAEQFKNKPPQAVAKIVEGKLNSFFQTVCLLDQGFVKDPEKTVKSYVAEVGKKLGDEIAIRRFVRFQVGETPAV